ncbi:hypothetical protein [Hahella sp. CCB-MM4]|uniref:hypothetical protein n=1 Tax=Hahella sp. (strain CCB-MM4) TaxID=1926491 RepID=UPI0011401BDF|nr:hypothetical protein [Hahella sp. CCB-MM4]
MNKSLYLILSISLIGCVEVGYKPYSYMSGGYKDRKISESKYEIEYVAYSTKSEKVLPRWHMRAAELCPNGYDVLSLNDGDNTTTTMVASGGLFIPVASNDVNMARVFKTLCQPSHRSM